MKLIILILSLAITIFARLSRKEEEIKWKEFKREFSKAYDTKEAELTRKKIFLKNYEKMLDQNKKFSLGQSLWRSRVYDHFDQTKEEFMKTHGGLLPSIEAYEMLPPADYFINEEGYPDYWDVRIQGPGKVNPVRDQNPCGSCWAFASIFAIESAWSIKTGDLYKLSEQQLVDCDTNCNGCHGCAPFEKIFKYPMVHGITTEHNYPYVKVERECNQSAIIVRGYLTKLIHLPADEATIKKYISKKGGCAVAVNAENWYGYDGGIFDGADPESNKRNHAVGILGYGPNFWLLRNSWGDYGEDGYIRVANNRSGGLFMDYIYCAIV